MPNLLYQAEISELDRCLVLYKHILRLNITMEESVLMDVVQRDGNLFYNVSYLFVREGIVVQFAHLHHAVQVHIEKLKDDHEHRIVEENLGAADNVDVLQADHCFDFCVAHCGLPRWKFALEGLQGKDLISYVVTDLVDHAEGALAEDFQYFEAVNENGSHWVRHA